MFTKTLTIKLYCALLWSYHGYSPTFIWTLSAFVGGALLVSARLSACLSVCLSAFVGTLT